jgi:hypothetical protein
MDGEATNGGYVFVYDDDRGLCVHCLDVGGFANPLYCYYNHHADFSYGSYGRETEVAHDPTLPGTHREPEWEDRMYEHMIAVFGLRKTNHERKTWG